MALVTYLDVVNEILSYGFNDGPQVNRQRAENWVNEAQHLIARQVEGPEFQKNVPVQLVVNQYIYALPADFARVQDVIYPAMSTRLEPTDIQDFDVTDVTQVLGPPSRYALDQGNLFLFPNPQAADILTMRYIAVPPTLVNDTDVPVLNPNYLHLLVRYGLIRAFEAEDDYEASQQFQTVWEKQLDAYATDVQWRDADRPRLVAGTWGPQQAGLGSY